MGHQQDLAIEEYTLIDALDPCTIESIEAGIWHTLFLVRSFQDNDTLDVYGCGWDRDGQLGYDAEEVRGT